MKKKSLMIQLHPNPFHFGLFSLCTKIDFLWLPASKTNFHEGPGLPVQIGKLQVASSLMFCRLGRLRISEYLEWKAHMQKLYFYFCI